MTERSTGAVVGSIELRVVSVRHRRAALDFAFHRSSWGHGYATEAATALADFGFGTLGLRKITATCSPENSASSRVLTKIGMRLEGHLHDHVLVRGTWQDRLLFALTAPSTWRAPANGVHSTTDSAAIPGNEPGAAHQPAPAHSVPWTG